MVTADMMLNILFSVIVGMTLLASAFLQRRALSLRAYLGWGLLAVVLPILGPYLVILLRPGQARTTL